MLCAKFGRNWPSVYGEDFVFNFVNIFSLIRCYLLLEKGRAIHWGPPPPKKKKKKNLNCISPRMFCPESGRNWPSGSGEDVNIFSLFLYYLPLKTLLSPLEKWRGPSSQ